MTGIIKTLIFLTNAQTDIYTLPTQARSNKLSYSTTVIKWRATFTNTNTGAEQQEQQNQ